jgi:hypothetical protein
MEVIYLFVCLILYIIASELFIDNDDDIVNGESDNDEMEYKKKAFLNIIAENKNLNTPPGNGWENVKGKNHDVDEMQFENKSNEEENDETLTSEKLGGFFILLFLLTMFIFKGFLNVKKKKKQILMKKVKKVKKVKKAKKMIVVVSILIIIYLLKYSWKK